MMILLLMFISKNAQKVNMVENLICNPQSGHPKEIDCVNFLIVVKTTTKTTRRLFFSLIN